MSQTLDLTSLIDTEPSESFCILPWIHVFADEGGVMYPCCRSVGSKLPNVYNENGQPVRIQDENGLEKGWNSDYMRTLRHDMLEGRRPQPCERCYMYEDLGKRTHRQSQNEEYQALIPDYVAQTGVDGWAPLDLQTVDLRLGNLCNLRCRMCSPQSSKALIGEWADFYGVSTDHPKLEEFKRRDWFSEEGFWQVFEKHTAHIERLHFAGGEPLLIPQMFDFLDRLIELGRASNITLSYNTNLTILPQRIFELWPHFKNVRVTVSLDGFDQVNSFIRYPSDWPTLDNHMRILDTEADRLNCGRGLGINSTVQVYNIFRLDELLTYLATSFQRFEAPNLSILTYPTHNNIRLLPPEMKEKAAGRIRRFVSEFDGQWPARWQGSQLEDLKTSIEAIIEHMMVDGESAALNQFRRWNAHQDQYRGQNVCDVIPELAPLFEETSLATDNKGPAQ